MFSCEVSSAPPKRSSWAVNKVVVSFCLGVLVLGAAPLSANACWYAFVRHFDASIPEFYLGNFSSAESARAGVTHDLEGRHVGRVTSCTYPPSRVSAVELASPCANCGAGVIQSWNAFTTHYSPSGAWLASCFIADVTLTNGAVHSPPVSSGLNASGCADTYVVKLSPASGASEDSLVLTSVEPGVNPALGPSTADTALLVARVYQNNQLVPNINIRLTVDVINKSGGHDHGVDGDERHQNYAGKLSLVGGGNGTVTDNGKILTGNTDSAGLLFRFASPAYPNNPAGDHDITAVCTDRNCTQEEGPRRVWVGIKDLAEVPENLFLWRFIGETGTHPKNHYVTLDALDKLIDLAKYYHAYFPGSPLLRLNDSSLERGGLFDLYEPPKAYPAWKTPHKEHRMGTVIDIQANRAVTAIPPENYDGFIYLFSNLGMTHYEPDLHLSTGAHFHIRLLGITE